MTREEIKFEYAFESAEGITKGVYTLDDISNGKLPKLPIKYARICTGLKDKAGEGNDVYEGDVFEAVFKNCPDGFQIMGRETIVKIVEATVVFKWGRFMVRMMHPFLKEMVNYNLSDFLKNNEEKVVLGNIYEN